MKEYKHIIVWSTRMSFLIESKRRNQYNWFQSIETIEQQELGFPLDNNTINSWMESDRYLVLK